MRPQDAKFVKTLIDRFCAPKPTQFASVWAEENLVLNEPKIKGAFSFVGREYLRQMVDAWGVLPPELEGGTDFVTCAGTGVGKTISNIAGLCYRIGNDSTRALVVKPTSAGPAGAKSFNKTRLTPAIRATKCLREHIPTGAARFNFSSSQMMINGSTIDLTGSNSVGQLGENRCDVVWQDEIDKYPPQTESSKEANPITLADERTKSVAEARRYKQSTPTLDNTGIWDEFKKTDQRRYFVPCPHCKKFIVFAWSKRFTVFEVKGFEAFVRWDDKARNSDGTWDLDKVAKTAHAVCPHCTGKILNSHKHEMNKAGEWRATAKGVPGYVGWHLPSMYSTTRDCDFGAMAKKFLTAKRSLDGVKGFINSDLAEPDVNQSVSVDRVGAAGRQIEISGEWLKIMSVDYQQHAPYFWAMIRAWNGTDASHGIEYLALNQWDELDDLQAKHKIIPQAVIIDVGFNQAEVLQNCANLKMPTRCTLDEAIQDQLPQVNGWNPCKAFGNKRQYRDEETGLYRPFKINANVDPYSGTELAKQMRVELLEFKSDLFLDMLDSVRHGKTHFKWTIAPEVDTDEYHKHMAGKIRKGKKNNQRDYSWVQRRTDWADHILSCELEGFVLAYRLQLISFDATQTKNEDKETT
jgi:hypothetical protein